MTTTYEAKLFSLTMLVKETMQLLRDQELHDEVEIVEIKLQQILEGD
jgi:hypothetical protein